MRDINEFYKATLDEDFESAVGICAHDRNAHVWPEIIHDCIDRFDDAWRLDQISLVEVSGAFWTTRRVLDHMLAQGVPVTGSMRDAGRIMLCVPRTDEHSFGAQLLADQLRRAGFHVVLFINRPNAEIFHHLHSTHFDVVGLSIGYDQSLLGLADVIAEVRITSKNPAIAVALGGSSFEGAPSAYSFLNADIVLTNGQNPLNGMRDLMARQQVPVENRNV